MENKKSNAIGSKKVLYVITKSNFGGAQRYVFDLATNLPNEQFEVSVASGGNGLLVDKLLDARIRTITIPRLGRDINILDDIAVFFDLVRLFVRERPDVIHLNSSKIGGLGALAGRIYNILRFFARERKRARILFTAHGFAFNEPRGFCARNIIAFVSWLTVILSHHTIAVSKFDLHSASWMPFVLSKISIIYNGIRDINLKPRDEARKILLGNHADKMTDAFWVGTIAELAENKGLAYGIDSIAQLTLEFTKKNSSQKFVYVIVGEGEKRGELKALIKKRGLSDNVFLVGFKENAYSFLPAFDVFLLPSLKEGLPYVLLEAGIAKLPVIATTVGGIPEIIEGGESGILVESKDSKEITNALKTIFSDQNKRAGFGEILHKNVSQKFLLSDMVLKTIQIYTKKKS